MNKLKFAIAVFAVLTVLGCGENKPKSLVPVEGFASGNITIVADESFKPVIEQEERIFENAFPDATLNIKYGTENDVLRSFLNDSTRVAILPRQLTADEAKVLNSRKLPPIYSMFARDAVALIVNKASADTLITVAEIKKMLNGDTKTGQSIVFDNPNSSLVRYLRLLSGGIELKQKNIYALKSNKEVIRYVSEHTGAIGIVGFSWLIDPDDDYAKYVDNVQTVSVRNESSKTYPREYFKPSQNTLVLNQYPLSRELYLVNSTGKVGLGSGFAAFLTGERGQRIILKSGLLPDSIPRREINIKKSFKTE
ncbi:phosphate ABC transporter substrate-binding protein [Mucilaginibacter limnophilus]|uniref:Phosphate ABC transporter substrate-binding protein n=1 Tax=Mucilaginibacter limnophilus TaxID=1932778 RepID=A0A3S2VNX0_9SPHI|nr:substrate-binding domain-containing protein [Mucilaginibacter limnophilus]RVU01835.1 phosphate ABC transporter substrate-binding protein [Mucilaginibacter limnophilus]